MSKGFTRRQFFREAALTGSAATVFHTLTGPASGAPISPNERLNIAIIGPGGRGAANLAGVSTENIVALCDVDERRTANAFEKYPRAERFRDFRRMLDKLDSLGDEAGEPNEHRGRELSDERRDIPQVEYRPLGVSCAR